MIAPSTRLLALRNELHAFLGVPRPRVVRHRVWRPAARGGGTIRKDDAEQ